MWTYAKKIRFEYNAICNASIYLQLLAIYCYWTFQSRQIQPVFTYENIQDLQLQDIWGCQNVDFGYMENWNNIVALLKNITSNYIAFLKIVLQQINLELEKSINVNIESELLQIELLYLFKIVSVQEFLIASCLVVVCNNIILLSIMVCSTTMFWQYCCNSFFFPMEIWIDNIVDVASLGWIPLLQHCNHTDGHFPDGSCTPPRRGLSSWVRGVAFVRCAWEDCSVGAFVMRARRFCVV